MKKKGKGDGDDPKDPSQMGLFDFSANPIEPEDVHFDGETYEPERDAIRLGEQMRRVFNVMTDGEWRTLGQLADATDSPEASVSARLRDLRKTRFGHRIVDRRHITNGLYEYRLVAEEPHGVDA